MRSSAPVQTVLAEPTRSRRLLAGLVAVGLMFAWLALAGAAPAHAATEPLTVSLYHVVELNCNEGVGTPCPDDFYPQFKIDGKGCTNKDDCTSGSWEDKDEYCCAHESDFRTNWTRTVAIDTTKNLVDIQLELWDQDDGNPDDPIRWVKGGDDLLDLTFDRTTCTFTGGGLTASQGGGVPNVLAGESESDGSDSARGFFTITTPSCLAKRNADANTDGVPDLDTDHDAIPDAWEAPDGGIDANKDGTIDYKPADDGALVYRRDIFIDADHMPGDAPQPGAIQTVKDAFCNAPVDTTLDPADPSKTVSCGITLHVDEGHADEVPEANVIGFSTSGPGATTFNDIKSGKPASPCAGFFGTAADRSNANCANILAAKRLVYRYMIFADTFEDKYNDAGDPDEAGKLDATDLDASGVSEIGGNDFLVTLATWDDDFFKDKLSKNGTVADGRTRAEAGTFMHELGHTLGLRHGGDEDTNCKPNYLSVMNYSFQMPRLDRDPGRPLDYSSAARGTALGLTDATRLDEANLDESRGVFGTPLPARNTVFGIGGKLTLKPATSGTIDWNGTGDDTDADLDYIKSIGACSDKSPGEVLHGFDDWANLDYNFRDSTDFADGDRLNVPRELSFTDLKAMFQQADVKIAKSADQAEAVAGDTVSYTTTVTDLGPGTAKDIKVTDTLPDGQKVDATVPDVTNGGTGTVTPKFTYLVPCTTADGAVLTNNVSVTANDVDGVPDPYTDDNTAQATTKVLAPVLSLAKTATPTVDAGDPITYTLTYANTGGAGASSVTITDTVPAGVYYSQALDKGAGPQPDTVTRNPDGTTTLTWTRGTLAASSGDKTISYTARPSMLFLPGDIVTNGAKLTFSNANGCTFDPLTDSATTTITAAPLFGDAASRGHWASHPADWTDAVLARVQATDQRFDSLDPTGLLTAPEIDGTLKGDSELDNVLRAQLLTLFLNMGSRHIGADSLLDSTRAQRLGLTTVRDAALLAQATLRLPPANNKRRYQDAIQVVQETSDIDGDGLSNSVEADLGTNPASADTDGDGVADGQDGCPTVAGTQNGCPAAPVLRVDVPVTQVVRVEEPGRVLNDPAFAKRLVPAGVTLLARRAATGRRAEMIVSRGTVVPAAGVSAAHGCLNGRVTVVVQAGRLTVSRRAVRLGADCAFASTVRVSRSRIGKRTVSVRAYFTGNDVLKRRTSPRVVVR